MLIRETWRSHSTGKWYHVDWYTDMNILEELAASVFNELNYSYPHFKLHLSVTSFSDSDIFLYARHIFLQLIREEPVTAETSLYILILPSYILLLSSSSGSSLHIQTVWVLSPISNLHSDVKFFCVCCARNNLSNIYIIYKLQHFWNWQQLMVYAGSYRSSHADHMFSN